MLPHMVIRPVAPSDLADLMALAVNAGAGMTNLPADEIRLRDKIERSQHSFAVTPTVPGDELYVFVLEDLQQQRVVGTAAIVATVGLQRPFYTFRWLNLVNTSRELDHYQPLQVLQMVDDFRGASELGMLYLQPDYRRDHLGRFLSKCRFLFMAQHPERFGATVIAELRGVVNAGHDSPFWEAVGRHFLGMEYVEADRLSALGHHQFIADLMPKHPIYLCLLPAAAQAVVGQTHPHTTPARRLLENEGFRFEGSVDVFDAGPTLQCPLTNIATLRDTRALTVTVLMDQVTEGDWFMVAHQQRMATAQIRRTGFRQIGLSWELARQLHLEVGATVHIAPL